MLNSLFILILTLSTFSMPSSFEPIKATATQKPPVQIEGLTIAGLIPNDELKQQMEMRALQNMFNQKAVDLSPAAKSYVLSAIQCVKKKNIDHKNVLTVIDYSKPSSEKRLWVFDLEAKKLLYKTHVSHGIKTGVLTSDMFSNTHNSKASSLGVFLTKQSYYGRHGLAMRLRGLEAGFNDHAGGRAIVMHGGWYMEEPFVKKYGRPGRSWGCPAIPKTMSKKIINTIKDDGLLISYYPSEKWFTTSRYLNCDNLSTTPQSETIQTEMIEPEENRSPILFVEKNNNNRWDRHEPVVVLKADEYIKTFNTNAPLKRMLRRQIKNEEYIVLNNAELNQLLQEQSHPESTNSSIEKIQFVVPHVKRHRGRYLGTEMRIISLGDVKDINKPVADSNMPSQADYLVHFKKNGTLQLQSTDQFIRWLGL